jgi:hypothetical protein
MKNKLLAFLKSIPWFVWLTSLIYALVYLVYYKYYAANVPKGWVWVGGVGGDDSVYLGLMQFVVNHAGNLFSAVSPWHLSADPGASEILLIPEFSSPYWFYFLGLIAKFTKLGVASVMILVRIVLGFLLPVVVWVFLKEFLKPRTLRVVSFVFYHFAFGIGGLLFLGFSLFKEGHFNLIPFWPFTAMGNAVSYEMFEGTGLQPLTFLGRTYYVASILLGLLALVKLPKAIDTNRRIRHRIYWGILGGVALALSQAIYPITGVGFVVLAVLWLVVFGEFSTRPLRSLARTIIPAHLGLVAFFGVAALGGLPWFASLLIDKTHFVTYGSLKVNATPLPLLVSTAPLLLPALAFGLLKGFRRFRGYRLLVWGSVLVLGILFATNVFPLRTVIIYGLGGTIALLSFFFWDKKKKTGLFFWLWLLFAFFASIMPIRDWTPFLPARFMLLMWLPLSVLAAFWLQELPVRGWSALGGKVKALILSMILVVGALSAFFYSTWMLRKPLEPDVYARGKGDGGESLRPEFITRKFSEIGTQASGVGNIVEEYNIGYIIFGPNERAISNDIVTMTAFGDALELIGSFGEGKDKKVEVWRVKSN